MTRKIAALIPDLFFRSKLEPLRKLGWEIDYFARPGAQLAIADLDAPGVPEAMDGLGVPILGYTAHEKVQEWQARLGSRGLAVSRNEFSRRLVELVEGVAKGAAERKGQDAEC